jgi:hypothetical protein
MVRNRYWPFDARAAFFTSLILVPGLVALAVWLYRPQGPLATRLTFPPLLLAVLLGLLPVALVILGGVRSVEAAGVKIAFVAVQDVVNTGGVITVQSFIADNLGNRPLPVTAQDADKASAQDAIIASLKGAIGTYCVVADLKEGDDWWDTRLLVLVAGAVRLGSPKAVVFTTSATLDRPGGFVGWATSSELLRRLLAREPKFRDAYQVAQRDLLMQQLATPTVPGGSPTDPWKAEPLSPVTSEDEFKTERVLLGQVVDLEQQSDAPRSLTEIRVRDLFDSILHTEAVEREDDEGKWVETILTSTADFVAVTRGHQFENLVPRRAAVNAVLLAVTSGRDRTNGRAGERKT